MTDSPNVRNTRAIDPLEHLVGMMGGTDNYILGMEAQGQRELVASSEIPTDSPWDDLLTLGFTRGEVVSGDDMFTRATLPEGWSKQRTDHSMWSKIVDERGIERVSIFYKAAFYDRSAHAHIVSVGSSLELHAWYEAAAPALPEQWSLLTDTERLDYREALRANIENDEDFISRYATDDDERIARVARGKELLRIAVEEL